MAEGLKVTAQNLHKAFASKAVIKNLSIEINAGSFTSIVGPSGCGKSTLLRLVAGLETPTSGSISTDPQQLQKFSFVFQDANLLPWKSVQENVMLPLELTPGAMLTRAERLQKSSEALELVQLKESSHLFPHQLSGGMKMRVALARALVTSPQLLLLDEPFAALDEVTRFSMQDLLRSLWSEQEMTVLFVTHSIFEAVYLSERIILLSQMGAEIKLDQEILLPNLRQQELRTSEQYNKIASQISQRLRA